MICIYCLIDKGSNCFTKTEHVLSQSFGRFEKNLTLNIKNHPVLGEVVCDDCNQWFGNNIENHLARDTQEGMARFEHGVKEYSDYVSSGKKGRIKIKIHEGIFKGSYAYREYSSVENQVILKHVPQVGFKNVSYSDRYTYFPIGEIPDGEYIRENFDLESANAMLIIGSESEHEVATCALADRGIKFNRSEVCGIKKQADYLCEVQFQIDITIRRAISKIAFNYLAYTSGPEFVRSDYFNPIRKFIRYGEVGTYPFCQVVEQAILGDEPLVGRRRLGHILTINYDESMTSIYSQVSLFNDITYSILLSNNCNKRDFCCQSGHFFNTDNGKISELCYE